MDTKDLLMGCRCGGGAEHEHATDPEASMSKSLYPYIDLGQCSTLNVKNGGSLHQVVRARFSNENEAFIQSDVDPQMILKFQ